MKKLFVLLLVVFSVGNMFAAATPDSVKIYKNGGNYTFPDPNDSTYAAYYLRTDPTNSAIAEPIFYFKCYRVTPQSGLVTYQRTLTLTPSTYLTTKVELIYYYFTVSKSHDENDLFNAPAENYTGGISFTGSVADIINVIRQNYSGYQDPYSGHGTSTGPDGKPWSIAYVDDKGVTLTKSINGWKKVPIDFLLSGNLNSVSKPNFFFLQWQAHAPNSKENYYYALYNTWSLSSVPPQVLKTIPVIIEDPTGFNNSSTCYTGSSFDLNTLNKTGGMTGFSFVGNGVSGSTFTPQSASVGVNNITATKVYGNGTYTTSFSVTCTNSFNDNVFVPTSDGYIVYPVCKSGGNQHFDVLSIIKSNYQTYLNSTLPITDYGDYNTTSISTYISGTDLNYTNLPLGDYYIQANYNVNGCDYSNYAILRISNGGGAIIAYPSGSPFTRCLSNRGSLTLSTGTPNGSWTGSNIQAPTSTATLVDLSTLSAGTYTYSYSAMVNGCLSTSNVISVTLATAPVVHAGTDTSVCYNDLYQYYDLKNSRNVDPPYIDYYTTKFFVVDQSTYQPIYFANGIMDQNYYFPTNPITSSYSLQNYRVGLQIYYEYDQGSCSGTGYKQLYTKGSPLLPQFSTSVFTVCSGFDLTINATVPGGVGIVKWYNSDPTGALTSPGLNTGFSYTISSVTGSKNIYVRSELNGCYSPVTVLSVIVLPIPTVNAGVDIYVCKNSPVFNLNTGDQTPVGGSWSGTGVLGNIFSFTGLNPGNYQVGYTYTNSYGCAITDYKKITLVNNPVITSVGSPISVCGNAMPFVLSDFSVIPRGGVWSGRGISDSTLTASVYKIVYDHNNTIVYSNYIQRPVITYTVSNPVSGCSTSANRNVVILPVPESPVVSAIPLCNSGIFTLTANGIGVYVQNNDSYKWYTNKNLTGLVSSNRVYATPLIASTKVYWVNANNTYNCVSAVDSVPLVIFNSTTLPLPSDTSLCNSYGNVDLSTWLTDAPLIINSTFPGLLSGSILNTFTHIGSYPVNFSFTNIYGCSFYKKVNVNVDVLPSYSIGSDTVVCSDSPLIPLTQYIDNGLWTGEGINQNAFFDVSAVSGRTTTVTYTGINGGCTKVDRKVFRISQVPDMPTVINSDGKTSLCNGDQANFEVQNNTITGLNYNWYSVQSTQPIFTGSNYSFLANQNQNLSIRAVNTDGCNSSTFFLPVYVVSLKGVMSTEYTFYSFGDPVKFQVQVTGDSVKSYAWKIGKNYLTADASPVVYNYDSGNVNVSLKLISFKGCVLNISRNNMIRIEGTDFKQYLAIKGTKGESISVYPNPFIENLFIEFSDEAELYGFSLINSEGQLMPCHVVHDGSKVLVQGVELSSGLYLLNITDKRTGNKKSIKVTKL